MEADPTQQPVKPERKTLVELQELLEEEAAIWEKAGLSIDNASHSNGSIFLLKQMVQAVMNLMIMKAMVTEDEINVEFKTIMLNSMVEMREQFGPAIEQAKINALLGRPQEIALPESNVKLVDRFGNEIKL